jgi:hypothetical protein
LPQTAPISEHFKGGKNHRNKNKKSPLLITFKKENFRKKSQKNALRSRAKKKRKKPRKPTKGG